jgi:hypothetical protein
MHAVDVAAWADILGVGKKELPWAIQARMRVIEDTHGDVNRIRLALRDAPDEDLVIWLEAACRALASAGERLGAHLSDLSKQAS